MISESRCSRYLQLLFVLTGALLSLPAWAQRPLEGEARPPIHVRGNATTGPTGLSPAQIRHAYGFDQIANLGAGQTLAIVDAFDDPNIESDLSVFNSTLLLPACTTANGCFRKIYATHKPRSDAGWSLEMSLDVEWAHAIAPQAKILLVEAASASFTDLMRAVDVAVQNGASVVSMSFGGNDFSSEVNYDYHFAASHVTFVASSGDSGNGVEYPAASPNVVAVGGTTLQILDSTGSYGGETAWSGSGGGKSAYEVEPYYQTGYPIPNDTNGKRGVPDVAYDADPNTGFPVYDTVSYQGQAGWFQVGGTSAGAPQWSALFAIVNSLRVANGRLPLTGTNVDVYATAQTATYSTNFHDITAGTNGTCGLLCNTAAGYDYVTGLGSPQAKTLIPALVGQP
jgi:subtilase family serine protease